MAMKKAYVKFYHRLIHKNRLLEYATMNRNCNDSENVAL